MATLSFELPTSSHEAAFGDNTAGGRCPRSTSVCRQGLATHSGPQVQKLLSDAVQAALLGIRPRRKRLPRRSATRIACWLASRTKGVLPKSLRGCVDAVPHAVRWLPYARLVPTLSGIAVFTFWVNAFRRCGARSFSRTPPSWSRNSLELRTLSLLSSSVFQRVLLNTLVYVLGSAVGSVALGFILAVVLHQLNFVRGPLIGTFFYPSVIPVVSAASIWLFMYSPTFGLLNQSLSRVGLTGPNWLGSRLGSAVIDRYVRMEAGWLLHDVLYRDSSNHTEANA